MTRSTLLTPASRLALLAIAALFLAACGGPAEPGAATPRPTSQLPAARPAAATSAPLAAAAADASCTGTAAHGKHLSVGIACASCHPCGGQYGFDNPVAYPGGTTSAGGTITLGTATTPTTCAVGCHSPLGSPAMVVAWTTPGPLACTACHAVSSLVPQHPPVSPSATRAECEACHNTGGHTGGTVTLVGHPAGWMNTADPGFHAFSADRGLASCQQCHLADLSGGVTGFSCSQCHDRTDSNGNVVSWRTNCTMCHGGVDNQTGAPPEAIWGYGADAVRVGAHGAHVTGSAIAPAFDCALCHVKPADALSAGHIDEVAAGAVPMATVVFSGLASGGVSPPPSWDRGSATCSSTYCHGATLSGGTNKMPIWTLVGQGQAACGTCHGVPPPPPHPVVTGGLAACNPCHADTIDPAGNVIPPTSGGKHLSGMVEATGHGVDWMDQTSPGFHAYSANRGIANCTGCHGADLSGGTVGVACSQCHHAGGPASDFATCTGCHGGTANQTGAPPRPTWGNADPLAVGAHTSHLAATHALALPFDCTACHVKPTSVFSPNHIEGAVTVTGYTGADPALAAAVTDPGWSRATGSCAASYCHGATLQGGANRTPGWTVVNGSQVACGTCHGIPPSTGWHPDHVAGGNWWANANCSNCHAGIATGSAYQPPVTNGAIVGPAQHVNGTRNVVFGGFYGGFKVQGYPAGTTLTWDPVTRTCSNVSCHRLDALRGVGPYPWGP